MTGWRPVLAAVKRRSLCLCHRPWSWMAVEPNADSSHKSCTGGAFSRPREGARPHSRRSSLDKQLGVCQLESGPHDVAFGCTAGRRLHHGDIASTGLGIGEPLSDGSLLIPMPSKPLDRTGVKQHPHAIVDRHRTGSHRGAAPGGQKGRWYLDSPRIRARTLCPGVSAPGRQSRWIRSSPRSR